MVSYLTHHGSINIDNYSKWFNENILPNIKLKSVLVVDNASYHNVECNNSPTSSSKKGNGRLVKKHNIQFSENCNKPVLYDIIKFHKPRGKEYVLNKLLQFHGHSVLRLQSYHLELSPIGLCWRLIKGKDVMFDPFADPNNPRKIKYEDIVSASRRIVGAIRRTPCLRANMSDKLGIELYLKQESAQFTGSFKERGVINTLLLLPEEQRKLGVICASRGNHGSALSYHSKTLGIPCVVVMTVQSPLTKIMKTEMHGAKTLLHGTSMAEATRHAMTISKQNNMLYVSGFDHPNVIEGQGTLALEVLEQVPDVDVIIVPVGGGSLLAGLGVVVRQLKPNTELYGVQTDKTFAMVESLRRNERTRIECGSTIADGLAVNLVGVNTFHNIKGVVDKMVLVKEDWVSRAIMHIAEEERFIIEGAGAVPIAAIMAGLFPNLKGKKVVCVLTGGNIDTTTLTRVLERGMAIEGRLVKFKVTLSDRPGGMAELCSLLAHLGVTLRDSVPERAWVKGDVFSVEMKIIAETRGWEHTKELIAQIKKNYKECYFPDMATNSERTHATSRKGPCLAPNPICMQ